MHCAAMRGLVDPTGIQNTLPLSKTLCLFGLFLSDARVFLTLWEVTVFSKIKSHKSLGALPSSGFAWVRQRCYQLPDLLRLRGTFTCRILRGVRVCAWHHTGECTHARRAHHRLRGVNLHESLPTQRRWRRPRTWWCWNTRSNRRILLFMLFILVHIMA